MRTKFSDLRILVVEDQAEARAHLREMLMDLGISQIYEAADGQNGLRLADHALGFIDIILCDWNMPSMSGLELLHAIRKKGEAIPFLMITGRSDETSMMSAKAAGVSGFIRKPYGPEQIEAKLRVVAAKIGAQ